MTVNLTMTFAPTSGADDPAVGFSVGSCAPLVKTLPCRAVVRFAPPPSRCPRAQTAGATSVGVQTGTVAGTITITAQLVAAGQNITPAPAPSQTIQIPTTAPVITSVTAASTSTGFTVTMVGYSNTRDLSQAVFVFTAASWRQPADRPGDGVAEFGVQRVVPECGLGPLWQPVHPDAAVHGDGEPAGGDVGGGHADEQRGNVRRDDGERCRRGAWQKRRSAHVGGISVRTIPV